MHSKHKNLRMVKTLARRADGVPLAKTWYQREVRRADLGVPTRAAMRFGADPYISYI